MPTSLFALCVLAGAALYFMSPEERKRLLGRVLGGAAEALRAAKRSSAAERAFDEFLSARARWPIVTPLLIVASVLVFASMVLEPGAVTDPPTLLAWGANLLTRTTSGELWRLVTFNFVHGGLFHLLATIAALLTVGVVLERTVGRIAFAAVFFGTGVVAGVVSLWTAPLTAITYGASGAVFGIYGLAIATAVFGCLREPRLPIPRVTANRMAVGFVLFAGYNLLSDHMGIAAELAALGSGLLAGLATSRAVTERKPLVTRAPLVTAAAVLAALVFAVPLRGMIDARPELAKIAAVEERTANEYAVAVEKFKRGHLPAKALAQLIDRTILPALAADRARIEALRGAPRDQQAMIAAAQRYFDLRDQSWRRRAEGLRTGKLPLLNDAERTERLALDALTLVNP